MTGRSLDAYPIGSTMRGRLLSINVGPVVERDWQGKRVRTGIWKVPVAGPVRVFGLRLEGDEQADHRVHGGVDKAVYAYAQEDYDFWRDHEGIDTHPGLFGENLTVEGVDLGEARPGDRWRIGTAVFEVRQPRIPCHKLGIRLADARFPRRFQSANRAGAYLRVVQEGEISPLHPVIVTDRPAHGITLRSMIEALHDPHTAACLLEAPGLPEFWTRLGTRSLVEDR